MIYAAIFEDIRDTEYETVVIAGSEPSLDATSSEYIPALDGLTLSAEFDAFLFHPRTTS